MLLRFSMRSLITRFDDECFIPSPLGFAGGFEAEDEDEDWEADGVGVDPLSLTLPDSFVLSAVTFIGPNLKWVFNENGIGETLR
jgi:hypothetical protein